MGTGAGWDAGQGFCSTFGQAKVEVLNNADSLLLKVLYFLLDQKGSKTQSRIRATNSLHFIF
jgi:hypothetical protein